MVKSSDALDRLEALDAPAAERIAASRRAAALSAPQLTRRGRVRKWDRPKPPMDWRFWIGNLGKTLIATGLLMFGFVAYQLWGTGIETARAQSQLESEFDELLAAAPPISDSVFVDGQNTSVDPPDSVLVAPDPTDDPLVDDVPPPSDVDTAVPAVPLSQQNLPALEEGSVLAKLEIPRIGRTDFVVAGVQTGDLKKGPGHFPNTPLPGQLGNSAIAGHRTTYGAPFFDVDDLQNGDEIIATTLSGRFTYRVTGQQIVNSNDYGVVADSDPNRATLTLISCEPKYTAQRRIVITSELVAESSTPVGEAVLNYGRPDDFTADPVDPADIGNDDPTLVVGDETNSGAPDTLPGESRTAPDTTDVGVGEVVDDGEVDDGGVVDDGLAGDVPTGAATAAPAPQIVDAFSDGWFSDSTANSQVALWGALLALIGIGAYLASRKLHRDWAGAMVGIIPFVVVAYFFFQNVNRLLPPNL